MCHPPLSSLSRCSFFLLPFLLVALSLPRPILADSERDAWFQQHMASTQELLTRITQGGFDAESNLDAIIKVAEHVAIDLEALSDSDQHSDMAITLKQQMHQLQKWIHSIQKKQQAARLAALAAATHAPTKSIAELLAAIPTRTPKRPPLDPHHTHTHQHNITKPNTTKPIKKDVVDDGWMTPVQGTDIRQDTDESDEEEEIDTEVETSDDDSTEKIPDITDNNIKNNNKTIIVNHIISTATISPQSRGHGTIKPVINDDDEITSTSTSTPTDNNSKPTDKNKDKTISKLKTTSKPKKPNTTTTTTTATTPTIELPPSTSILKRVVRVQHTPISHGHLTDVTKSPGRVRTSKKMRGVVGLEQEDMQTSDDTSTSTSTSTSPTITPKPSHLLHDDEHQPHINPWSLKVITPATVTSTPTKYVGSKDAHDDDHHIKHPRPSPSRPTIRDPAFQYIEPSSLGIPTFRVDDMLDEEEIVILRPKHGTGSLREKLRAQGRDDSDIMWSHEDTHNMKKP